jgi:hypothetical protein
MIEKQFYDYEEESGNKLKSPRSNFRNMSEMTRFLSFPFTLEKNNSYYDIYIDPKTTSYIWVIGNNVHNYDKKQAAYKEGIVLYCEPRYTGDLIKRISSVLNIMLG